MIIKVKTNGVKTALSILIVRLFFGSLETLSYPYSDVCYFFFFFFAVVYNNPCMR